jgi:hypothetical protein
MNPQELSTYITSLLRSGPEIITAFIMGGFVTGTLLFALRHWVRSGRGLWHPSGAAPRLENTPPELPSMRLGEEIERRDAEILRLTAQLASLEWRPHDKVELVPIHGLESATPELYSVTDASLRQRCDLLAGENKRLLQSKQTLEQTIERLQTELANARIELAHWAKWSKLHEEKNAQLTESEPMNRS